MVPDYITMANRYAEAVASGWMPTNQWLQLAAQRYLDMLEMAEDPKCEFYFSPLHVIDYCEFAEKLRHFEGGSWEITQLQDDGTVNDHIILEPFEMWMEAAIQGFRRRRNGTRLVETALELIPRKNAKSLRATRAALFELCCSNQLAPQIPIAAATEKQAEQTLFGDILAMVKNEKEMVEHFGLTFTTKEIRRGDGVIFMLSSQGERQDGLNPSLALFEEGHAGADSVYKVVDSAFGARPNAQRRMITTAGYRPEGPAHELMLQCQMILRGDVEDYTFFGAIYTLDREDYTDLETKAIDWDKLLTDEGLIAMCNPMYGVGLDPVKIRKAVLEAHKARIDKRGEQARTRFNIWTGAGVTLIDEAKWAACKRNISLEDFIGWKCWIGVDLAQVLDMCAIALLFELPTGEIVVFVKYFLPELSPTASHPDLVDHIMNWRDQGYLELTPGPLADHDLVRQEVEAYCDVFDVQIIACDPAQAHNTVKILWDGSKPVMTYPNSAATMTAPTDDILGRIEVETIWHDGNPMLNWNAANVYGERKGNGSIMPRKDKPDSVRKIDGFVAICFANGCRIEPDNAKAAGETQKTDVYVTRGLIGYREEQAL